ncbi:hypothetical protein [Siminovitchia sp. 179-K 8D1 HS]|uniref:hypothetical protein n=1 Tax=Siminovitchia sp. 179-K 8D1 HS TaxID=3142385 RepID=UPI0039A0F1ED
MRGRQKTKNAGTCLNKSPFVKRLALLYLLFFIASHLISPINAYYTYQERIVGEISVDVWGERDLEELDAPAEDKEQISKAEIKESEKKEELQEKPAEIVEQVDEKEKEAEIGDAEKQIDHDAAEPNEENTGKSTPNDPIQTDKSNEAKEQEIKEDTP